MKKDKTNYTKKTKKKKDILAIAKGICDRYDDTMKDLAK